MILGSNPGPRDIDGRNLVDRSMPEEFYRVTTATGKARNIKSWGERGPSAAGYDRDDGGNWGEIKPSLFAELCEDLGMGRGSEITVLPSLE